MALKSAQDEFMEEYYTRALRNASNVGEAYRKASDLWESERKLKVPIPSYDALKVRRYRKRNRK